MLSASVLKKFALAGKGDRPVTLHLKGCFWFDSTLYCCSAFRVLRFLTFGRTLTVCPSWKVSFLALLFLKSFFGTQVSQRSVGTGFPLISLNPPFLNAVTTAARVLKGDFWKSLNS